MDDMKQGKLDPLAQRVWICPTAVAAWAEVPRQIIWDELGKQDRRFVQAAHKDGATLPQISAHARAQLAREVAEAEAVDDRLDRHLATQRSSEAASPAWNSNPLSGVTWNNPLAVVTFNTARLGFDELDTVDAEVLDGLRGGSATDEEIAAHALDQIRRERAAGVTLEAARAVLEKAGATVTMPTGFDRPDLALTRMLASLSMSAQDTSKVAALQGSYDAETDANLVTEISRLRALGVTPAVLS